MDEAEFMQFKDQKDFFEKEGNDNWIYLYKSINEPKNDFVVYSCLLKKDYIVESLKDTNWDYSITYTHSSENIKPILIKRHYYGIKEDYWEIAEDIKLFFNLFEDKQNKKFIYINDNGDEDNVIVFDEEGIKIKRLFLKEYLFAKKLVFIQFFDCIRYSEKDLGELKAQKTNEKREGDNFVYHIMLDNNEYHINEYKSVASVIGKKIISVPDTFKTILFSEEKKYEDFIIGIDENGENVEFTCNEEFLANYFGKNKGNPHYLTPVFFKKEVLDKYYGNSEKYSVSDGYLGCKGLWGLRMDNSHKDIVMVFLGDLGHLSYEEQKYWKQYNIVDGKISPSCFKRSFLAEFCDPDTADLFFKQRFKIFQERWYKKYGWHLFIPLKKGDEHFFDTLRIPTKESQQEFDNLIQAIAKIMIDSINVKEIKKGLIKDTDDEEIKSKIKDDLILITEGENRDKSIGILKKYLAQIHKVQFPEMETFLKDLQKLRSSGSAHRKGEGYEEVKKKFSLENNFKEVFEKILIECIKILTTLMNKKYGLL